MVRFVTALAVVLAAAPVAAQDAKLAERSAMSRLKGNANASVVVFEFADFQCPYCARFAREVYPRIDSAYVKTGKVQWIFVNLPLPNHPNAWAAAEAAMCAGAANDKFWPMHDRLFLNQTEWGAAADPAALLTRYARESGVAMDAYHACVEKDRIATLLIRDVMYASNARVSGTPAFVINNEPIFVGMKSFEEWQDLLDAALKKPKN
jgi:protein-disulfide isomerase